jgi:hypothetical protein
MVDINKGKTVLHLRTKGIWAFFNPNGTVEIILLGAPFFGDVHGIKLGDDAKKVTTRLGNPIKKPYPAFVTMSSYQYAIDDSAYVAFDLNDDGVQYLHQEVMVGTASESNMYLMLRELRSSLQAGTLLSTSKLLKDSMHPALALTNGYHPLLK